MDAFKNITSLFLNCFEYLKLKIVQQMKGNMLKIKAQERRDIHIFSV